MQLVKKPDCPKSAIPKAVGLSLPALGQHGWQFSNLQPGSRHVKTTLKHTQHLCLARYQKQMQ
jgi:hypothetical protein